MPIKSDTTEPQGAAPSPSDLAQVGAESPPVGADKPALENPAPGAFLVSLDEFCSGLSARVRRPELIGGWHAYCRDAGLLHAPTEVFDALFVAYLTHPA